MERSCHSAMPMSVAVIDQTQSFRPVALSVVFNRKRLIAKGKAEGEQSALIYVDHLGFKRSQNGPRVQIVRYAHRNCISIKSLIRKKTQLDAVFSIGQNSEAEVLAACRHPSYRTFTDGETRYDRLRVLCGVPN